MAGTGADGTRTGRWASPAAEREYLSLYDELLDEQLDRLGADVDASDVPTRYGSTRVYSFAGEGLPVVLLPGAGASSLMWLPVVERLRGHAVHALDTLGDPGRSEQRAPLASRDELGYWLADVLDALAIERAHLVGASYGAWIATTVAQQHPERVASLTLAEPVLAKVRPKFWVHGLAVGVAMPLPLALRRAAARALHTGVLATDDRRVLRMGFLGLAKYKRGLPPFVPATDDELSALPQRTVVLLGSRSAIHHSRRLARRLERVAPQVEVVLVARGSHSLPLDRPEVVAQYVRRSAEFDAPTC